MPRALLSVYDKTGIVEFARGLRELGWSLVSSGGTARALADAGLAVSDVADITGVPAILGHRVVTLHPKIHGGLLADPTDIEHRSDMAEYGIEPFSLVVVNLYPFSSDPSIELIDVGGPAMVRAAAKNHAHVGVVCNPVDYDAVLDELRRSCEVLPDAVGQNLTSSRERAVGGSLSAATRRRLARDAFASTAAYDAAIVNWLDGDETLPPTLHLAYEQASILRYGENPHQRGARYRRVGSSGWWDRAVQHQGKEMSYLNLYDAEAAWRLVNRFDGPAAVVVKHANPCGVALADDIVSAYRGAHECDPVSAFGGIVALNRPVPRELAEALAPVFTEVVVAPSYEPGALEVFARKANVRVITAPLPTGEPVELRTLDGGLLVQEADPVSLDRTNWTVVSERQPTAGEWDDLVLGWVVVAAVSSNAIVIAAGGRAVGIGAGQQNRLDSARIAVEKAGTHALGGVGASDAFFPFRDGLDALATSGVTAVIEPGGSVRDDEVIAAANEQGLALVFTSQRHFRH